MWSVVCKGCNELIQDRYMLRVQDGLWHERCLHCASCREPLTNTCFIRNKSLYCKRDYQKLFLVRCKGCAEVISPDELVMRAGTAVFHLRCFCCCVCACRLQKGDHCVFTGDRLLCARDYHNTRANPTTSDSGKSEDEEEDDDEGNISTTGHSNTSADVEHKRPKRPRTILTTQQRRAFKTSFEVSSKPCRKVRETLAAETGLSVRVVQVWFQNQRAKMKKLAKRQQQHKQNMSPQEKRDSHAQLTAPSCGGLPTELECTGSYAQQNITVESHSFKLDPFRQGLTPPQMPGDYMHPYGCDTLYDSTDSDPLCHFSDCLSSSDASLLTPIDRLYSMQDSYFTS